MLLRVVVVLVVIGVTVYALVDCWASDGPSVRLLPRALWFIVVLVPVVGPVLWLVAGRPREEPEAPMARPLAPDDDPEFLRNLEIRHRNQAEADRLKKLKEELDAKDRKHDAGNSEAGGSEGAGGAHEPGDAGTPGTDEVM